MDLSVIIVNWNSVSDVRKCVESILTGTCEIDYEIIVVDGASYDGCGEMLAEEFPRVRFIQSDRNIGFGRANNLASMSASGELLLFLNPDTEVVGHALFTMARAYEALPKAGCLGCRLLNSDRTLQTSCIQSFPTLANQILDSDWLRRTFPRARLWGTCPLFDAGTEPTVVEAISGACLMIRQSIFREIGGFSPEYFMYAEDIDLCLKSKIASYTNYYVPTAMVVHHGDSSSGKARSDFAVVMAMDSLTRYFSKFHGHIYARVYRTLITIMASTRLLALSPGRFAAVGKASARASRMWSWKKWKAILRWGLGLEHWIKTYQHSNS